MHEYDYNFWKTIDEMTWKQVKRCAKTVFYTLIGVLITVALQPVRLYEYVRFKWDNWEEAVIERESEERFNNLVTNGHI